MPESASGASVPMISLAPTLSPKSTFVYRRDTRAIPKQSMSVSTHLLVRDGIVLVIVFESTFDIPALK